MTPWLRKSVLRIRADLSHSRRACKCSGIRLQLPKIPTRVYIPVIDDFNMLVAR